MSTIAGDEIGRLGGERDAGQTSADDANGSAAPSDGGDSTACTNLDSNPHHCGACGHDCLGGACELGSCQPTLVASLTSLGQFTLDSEFVYYTDVDPGTVMKVPLAGGASVTLASGITYPFYIAVDATDVYFAQFVGTEPPSGSINKVSKFGGAVTTLATTPTSEANGFALDSEGVYWTTYGSAVYLGKVPLQGGNVTKLVTGPSGTGLAVHDGRLYWAEDKLMSLPTAGGTPAPLGEEQVSEVMSVAFYSDSIYWLNMCWFCPSEDGQLMKMPLAGGPAVELAGSLNQPRDLAVDDSGVYWIEDRGMDSGTPSTIVLRLRHGASAPVSVASMSGQSFGGLALSADSIFFTNGNPATQILRLAK